MIDAHTKLLALLGHPVSHSLSPLFQNAALRHLRLPFVYLAFDVAPEHLGEVVLAFRVLKVPGFNVTLPHKEAVCSYLDKLQGEAALVSSVNTVVAEEERLIGYNTDVYGFRKSLEEEKVEVEGKTFLLLGAGGVARALLFVLAEKGVRKVFLANRTKSRAEALLRWASKTLGVGCEVLDWSALEGGEGIPGGKAEGPIDGIIQATSLGMAGEVPPVPWESLAPWGVVVDVVYHQDGTPLVREAKRRGFKSFDGKRMLLHQGARSFTLFTGIEAPLGVMEEALGRR